MFILYCLGGDIWMFFFFQAEDGIRDLYVTGVQTCALPISPRRQGMELRSLGRTGLTVSTLGFGCGNVGGLMIRGTPADQERAVGRALDLGITYYDTAPSYGAGESERNLGRVLRTLRAPVLVGTKFRVEPEDHGRVAEAVRRSEEHTSELQSRRDLVCRLLL